MTDKEDTGLYGLFEERKKIFPAKVSGTYRRLKWIAMVALLGIYYLLPWMRWDRDEGLPDQAVLIDTIGRKFYFFFIEVWPQEVYIFTGLLVVAAVTLFFVTSLVGRVWCGYACPQTVWTDLFMTVERWIEGDRNKRIKLETGKWTWEKIWRKITKHIVWLLIALCTGGAWVFYFVDAPTLMSQILVLEIPFVPMFWILLLTLSTYMFAGFAREQVCTYMCPYARFQGAMFDVNTLIVSYDESRGEPRGKSKNQDNGDCVDCGRCTAVCPTGIDIRDGQQYQCITCALCIDACNDIMTKLRRPAGLIRYDTLNNMQARAAGKPEDVAHVKLLRPRTVVYMSLILMSGLFVIYTLSVGKKMLDINVLRDRNPLYIQLSNGDVRNAYTVHVLNKFSTEQIFTISVNGLAGAQVSTSRNNSGQQYELLVKIKASDIGNYRLFVDIPKANLKKGHNDIKFIVTGEEAKDIYDGAFIAPNN
jgi:cytochrome c oxidase accessory protein FixG